MNNKHGSFVYLFISVYSLIINTIYRPGVLEPHAIEGGKDVNSNFNLQLI